MASRAISSICRRCVRADRICASAAGWRAAEDRGRGDRGDLDAEKSKFSWREEKATKQPGAVGDIEKAIKGALNVRKWQRIDHAMAEIAVGLVIKFESRDAQEIAKKLAKLAKEKPAPGAKPAAGAVPVPKF